MVNRCGCGRAILSRCGRSEGDEIGQFKSGLYYLCKKRPDLECIPVHIDNMNRILPRGEVLPVPLLTCVSFGPPIWLEAGERERAHSLHRRALDTAVAAQDRGGGSAAQEPYGILTLAFAALLLVVAIRMAIG